ncbi:MAG TPA: hypothetical protein VGI19_01185 [Candidatus Cybelea sp.]
MFDRPAPKPAYWKALVTTLVFLVPTALLVRLFVRMPAFVWWLLLVSGALAIAWAIYSRMENDWRAAATMHAQDFYRRTTVARNVRSRGR